MIHESVFQVGVYSMSSLLAVTWKDTPVPRRAVVAALSLLLPVVLIVGFSAL